MEDFSFDMTGKQALELLNSDALKEFKEKHGDDIPILVEGRVGIIKSSFSSSSKNDDDDASSGSSSTIMNYIEELRSAGATGAIIGGGVVPESGGDAQPLQALLEGSNDKFYLSRNEI